MQTSFCQFRALSCVPLLVTYRLRFALVLTRDVNDVVQFYEGSSVSSVFPYEKCSFISVLLNLGLIIQKTVVKSKCSSERLDDYIYEASWYIDSLFGRLTLQYAGYFCICKCSADDVVLSGILINGDLRANFTIYLYGELHLLCA